VAIPNLDRILREMNDLDDVERAVRAADELDRHATVADVATIRKLMEKGNYFFRECLGQTLARLEGVAALPFLLDLLRDGCAEGHDHDGLGAAIMDLVEINKIAAAPILTELCHSASSSERRDAAWLWGFAGEAVPIQPLLALSRDECPEVRGAALGSLASCKNREEVFQALVGALKDPQENVRVDAISALGYYGDGRAAPLIFPYSRDKGEVGRIAKYAIGQLRRA
jgi:HEAT repeat protein